VATRESSRSTDGFCRPKDVDLDLECSFDVYFFGED